MSNCPFDTVLNKKIFPRELCDSMINNGFTKRLVSVTYKSIEPHVEELKKYIGDDFILLDNEDGIGVAIRVNPNKLRGYDFKELFIHIRDFDPGTSSVSKSCQAKEIVSLFEE